MKVIKTIIEKILTSNKKLYYTITGGGTRVISQLLENGGASGIFLGANVCYHENDTKNIVGSVTKLCSAEVASKLTLGGYYSNSSLDTKDNECVGISCTASLRKHGNEREGRIHEAFIGIRTYGDNGFNKVSTVYHILFTKDRTRKEEEDLLANLILAITCQSMTVCKWEISTHSALLKEFGFDESVDKISIITFDSRTKQDIKDEAENAETEVTEGV